MTASRPISVEQQERADRAWTARREALSSYIRGRSMPQRTPHLKSRRYPFAEMIGHTLLIGLGMLIGAWVLPAGVAGLLALALVVVLIIR
jgi:uncharacterized membrane protein YkgB